MDTFQTQSDRRTSQAARSRRIGAAALALALAMTILAGAAEERAVKSRVAPVYPELAKRMRISGTVKLELTVDAEGKVTAVKTLSGNHALSPAAEDAVSKWKFVAASAPSTVDVEVSFSLAP
jgi:TonB family protein